NALQDSDWRVRIAALEALPTLVEKGAEVQLLLPPILNALKDSNEDVRSAARKFAEKLSTESLIEVYWITQYGSVIPFLIPRLYEEVLTIQNTGQPENKLVLRNTKGDVVATWMVSIEVVKKFKTLIQEQAHLS
ncbi:MAG: HEAT repeat domain-containing protein, partial [Bacteroidota bacterium]